MENNVLEHTIFYLQKQKTASIFAPFKITSDYAEHTASKPPLANNHISVDCVVIGFDGEQLKSTVSKTNRRGGNGEVYRDMKLPGSLIYMDEDLDEAAQRVLCELTGLSRT